MLFWDEIYCQINALLLHCQINFYSTNDIYYNPVDSSSVRLYLINDVKYYAKVFLNRDPKLVHEELTFMRYLKKNDIMVPGVLLIDKNEFNEISYNGNKVVFFFAREVSGDDVVDRETLFDIVRNIAKMHSVSRKYKIENKERLAKCNIERLHLLIKDSKKLVDKMCSRKKLELIINEVDVKNKYSMIHGDLHKKNIITRKGKFYGLIDFSDCRLGHFEDDIGKIVQSFLTVKACNIGDVKKVIREYNSVNNYILNTKEVLLSCVYHILYFVNVNYDYISDIEQYSHTIELCMQE